MKRFSINQDVLKIIALLLMTIDHIGMFNQTAFWSHTFRLIGRASYPIFALLLMGNLAQYQVFSKYLKRLGFFGVITFLLELPVQLIFNVPNSFNILLGFWVVVATLYIFHKIEKIKMYHIYQWLLFLPVFLLAAASTLPFSYNFYGFFFCFCLYFYFQKRTLDWLALSLLFSYLINKDFCGPIISLMTATFLLLFVQIKAQPRLLHRWWSFYVYYPAHIVILALIKYFL